MSWAEVHDEAEQLEHVVSERLIDRIDEMLGRPTHDPHGDPIPNPEGAITTRHLDSLLTCPIGTPLKVTRIADQDPAFLRFIESNGLKPGEPIEVESRDDAADAVRPAAEGSTASRSARAPRQAARRGLPAEPCGLQSIFCIVDTCDFQSFRFLLARRIVVVRRAGVAPRTARRPARPPIPRASGRLRDNSFLVEEAFNQEAGVVQNIFTWTRGHPRHMGRQLHAGMAGAGMSASTLVSIPCSSTGDATGIGDVLLNYRVSAARGDRGRTGDLAAPQR